MFQISKKYKIALASSSLSWGSDVAHTSFGTQNFTDALRGMEIKKGRSLNPPLMAHNLGQKQKEEDNFFMTKMKIDMEQKIL